MARFGHAVRWYHAWPFLGRVSIVPACRLSGGAVRLRSASLSCTLCVCFLSDRVTNSMPAILLLPPTPSTANAGVVESNGRIICRVSGPCSRLCDLIGVAAAGNANVGNGCLALTVLVALLGSVCSLGEDARRLHFGAVIARAERLGHLLDVLLEVGAVVALLDARASLERVRLALPAAAESLLADGVLDASDLVLGADDFVAIVDLVSAHAPPASDGSTSPLESDR